MPPTKRKLRGPKIGYQDRISMLEDHTKTVVPFGSSHIVVVDDDPDLRDGVSTYLRRHGYAVSEANGGIQLRDILTERAVDLVVLDINMPGEDGLAIAQYLRKAGPVGILMLTAASDTIDRVVGLEVGADDYVCKPFEPRELLARIRSVLRRVVSREQPTATMGHEVRFGRCMLNLDSRKLYDLSGKPIPVTPMEFDLLRTFAERPNRVLNRDQILELAHNREMDVFDRSVDLRVARLRRKIEVDPQAPQIIKTVRGVGYIFVPDGRGEPE